MIIKSNNNKNIEIFDTTIKIQNKKFIELLIIIRIKLLYYQ